MIVGLVGQIEKKEPTKLEINVQGVIYEVFVSINCSSKIDSKDIKIRTTHIIKEESSNLYGFVDKDEQIMFDRVIKINGVGPKVALAICSTFTPASFSTVIANKSVDMIKSVPGIGPKGASRLLVELSGFIIDGNFDDSSICIQEATMALESLGFKKEQIKKAISGCDIDDTAILIKQALKKLQR
jgi:Holliday junction DNA helicase RuvA